MIMEIADRAVSVVFGRIENKKEAITAEVESSFLPNKMKAGFREIFEERWSRLFKRSIK
jgi:hypothetical protein